MVSQGVTSVGSAELPYTFQSGRHHARAVVAKEIFHTIPYHANDDALFEGIGRWRVYLHDMRKLLVRLTFYKRLRIEEVDHQVAVLDTHHA